MRDDQIRRYARHVLLPEVGGIGQRRILAASVRVARAGRGGAAAIAYLAAAGVGRIVVLDCGRVAPHDVGLLYETADIGRPRAEAARDRVAALNPDCAVAVDGDGIELALDESGADDAVEALARGAEAAARLLLVLAEGA